MLSFATGRIFLVVGATDMRKSYDSLSGVVRDKLGNDPMSRDTFVFCNRDKNRLKILVYDESGAWVLAKRLDRGTFAWPSGDSVTHGVEYRVEQLMLLVRGFDAHELRPRRWRRRDAVQYTESRALR